MNPLLYAITQRLARLFLYLEGVCSDAYYFFQRCPSCGRSVFYGEPCVDEESRRYQHTLNP